MINTNKVIGVVINGINMKCKAGSFRVTETGLRFDSLPHGEFGNASATFTNLDGMTVQIMVGDINGVILNDGLADGDERA